MWLEFGQNQNAIYEGNTQMHRKKQQRTSRRFLRFHFPVQAVDVVTYLLLIDAVFDHGTTWKKVSNSFFLFNNEFEYNLNPSFASIVGRTREKRNLREADIEILRNSHPQV